MEISNVSSEMEIKGTWASNEQLEIRLTLREEEWSHEI
jgi:hypothetical protein